MPSLTYLVKHRNIFYGNCQLGHIFIMLYFILKFKRNLCANIVNFIDFIARFGRNMLQNVANWHFFCWRCQKVVEKIW